jgi:serine O-acetyltransferase
MNTVSPMETAAPLEMPHGRGTRLVVGLFPRQARGLVLQLREDWRTHYMDWTQPGFRAIVAHRFGSWVQAESGRGFVRGPLKWLLRRMHLSMFRYVRNQYGIELPATAIVGRRVLIGHQSGIVIHESAAIGDDCVIRQNVTIGALNGERGDESPVIGKRVELGAGATIIGPVTIGDGARIGPHSVVMTDVPAGATVFVNPPRMISLRSVTPASGEAAAPVRTSQAAGAAR